MVTKSSMVTCLQVALAIILFIVATISAHGDHSDFNTADIVKDKEHIKEHYKGVAELDEKNMTDDQWMFHYLVLHDFDNNTKLDGLELMHALIHINGDDHVTTGEQQKMTSEELKTHRDEAIANIDRGLKEGDANDDGFMSYEELRMQLYKDMAKAK